MNNYIDMIYRKFTNSKLLNNILTLVSGTAIGYGINLLGMPILGRVYSPKIMGEYDLILSTGTMFYSLLTLGLITTIMLPKKEKDSQSLCRVIAASIVILSSLAWFVLIIIHRRWKIFDVSADYILCITLLYVYTVFYNLMSVYFSYVNRVGKYKVLFWKPILYATSNVFLSITFGLWKWGVIGYLLATVIAVCITVLYMAKYVNPFGRGIPNKYVCHILMHYKEFPLIQMPANWINTLAQQLPIQFLGRFYGAACLGGYSMARKILSMPISLMATPINNVYYREASERIKKGLSVGDFAFSFIHNNLKIASIPILILMLFGEEIFGLFLGSEWILAGSYVKVLGPYYLVLFCVSCLSGGFALLKKVKVSMFVACFFLITNSVTFVVIGLLNIDFDTALMVCILIDMLAQIFVQGLFFYIVDFPVVKYMVEIAKYLFGICFAYEIFDWII